METPLPLDDYRRYGRQMILEGIGLPGQRRLTNASVVVVGAGGLGCPAIQYLAAAGVGRIGIVEGDTVDLSNLQRQVLHTQETVGTLKVESAAAAVRRLNSSIQLDLHPAHIDASTAPTLLAPYDIILDCTDNAPTRYLLSDTAVRLGKPLVSGAAQKFDGQLCTYNLALPPGADGRSDRGPCYRCLFPQPPARELQGSCAELGILGVVTGVIGTMQALEAVKIITGLHDRTPSLLLYSALSWQPFRSVKLRARRKTCAACGDEGARIDTLSAEDYVAFCGGAAPDWEARGLSAGSAGQRIRAKELHDTLMSGVNNVKILDVRPPTEFGICHLPSSTNVPLSELLADPSSHIAPHNDNSFIAVVCRLGNDSQIAAEALRGAISEQLYDCTIVDVIGGLSSWSKDVDPNFPVY